MSGTRTFSSRLFATKPAVQPAPAPQAEPRRILVVDDEEQVLEMLKATLVSAGYEVRAVADGAKALEALKQEQFAVVLTDNMMPGMNGVELLAHARELQPEATRILTTGVLNLESVIESVNKGEIYRFVAKPWLREELLATVQNAFQRHGLVRQNSALHVEALAMNQKLTDLNQSLQEQLTKGAVQNEHLLRLNRALDENLQRSVELAVHLLETFSATLGNQARRVHEVCVALGKSLRLSEEERKTLEIAAWLHDIGLIGFQRDLIRRWRDEPGKLKPGEIAALQNHPVVGEELTQFVQDLQDVGKVIRSHHECYNGEGYPDRLQGEQIPWLGRLLAVGVGFVETNLPRTEALEVIHRASGSAYDPDAVRALVRSLPKASLSPREREVLLRELEPGMVLAKGVYTANGLLLIPSGQLLSEGHILKLANHNQVNPITQSLLVYC